MRAGSGKQNEGKRRGQALQSGGLIGPSTLDAVRISEQADRVVEDEGCEGTFRWCT